MSVIRKVTSFEDLAIHLQGIDSDQILLVVDSNVFNIYRKKFDFINIAGKKVFLWKCLAGENTKQYDELKNATEYFLSRGVHRGAHLVAFGGGACSDFAGLVASLLLRGIKWSVVPTTLLAMIDASIGGKVAINSEYGKNLIGAFHMPENILIFDDFLETLESDTFSSGLGEMIKYCFLDKGIYDAILRKASTSEMIEMCSSYKHRLVALDLEEKGKRKVLNLGHTIGHAIEVLYEIPHGIAICWGLVVVFKVFEKEEFLVDMKILIDALNVKIMESPWHNKHFPIDDIMEYIQRDKKATSSTEMEIILVEAIGKPIIKSVTFDEIRSNLEKHKDELRKFIF